MIFATIFIFGTYPLFKPRDIVTKINSGSHARFSLKKLWEENSRNWILTHRFFVNKRFIEFVTSADCFSEGLSSGDICPGFCYPIFLKVQALSALHLLG